MSRTTIQVTSSGLLAFMASISRAGNKKGFNAIIASRLAMLSLQSACLTSTLAKS